MPWGRSEEPERPTEASREDAAAEDEPAERAVSPVSAEPGPVRSGERAEGWGMEQQTQRWYVRGGGGVAVFSPSRAGRRGLRGSAGGGGAGTHLGA